MWKEPQNVNQNFETKKTNPKTKHTQWELVLQQLKEERQQQQQ